MNEFEISMNIQATMARSELNRAESNLQRYATDVKTSMERLLAGDDYVNITNAVKEVEAARLQIKAAKEKLLMLRTIAADGGFTIREA